MERKISLIAFLIFTTILVSRDFTYTVNIYNLKGQLVKNLLQDNLNQGVHKVVWQGRDSNEQQVASGVYFYKISAGQKKSVTHKIILMK
jgi:flagellar hook assembly protein FlgD